MHRLLTIIFGRLSTNDHDEPAWSRRVRFATRFAAGGLALAFLFAIPFALPGQFQTYAHALNTLPHWMAGLLILMVAVGLVGLKIGSNGRTHDRPDDQDDDPPAPSRATTSGGEG